MEYEDISAYEEEEDDDIDQQPGGLPNLLQLHIQGISHPQTTTETPKISSLFKNRAAKMPGPGVPKPGPAVLSRNAGPAEWLEQAMQCHYLPEHVMKQLCEIVKEHLMEGPSPTPSMSACVC
jgi:hypothetical protein